MRINFFHGNDCTLEFEATSFEDIDLLVEFYVKWVKSDREGKREMLKRLNGEKE